MIFLKKRNVEAADEDTFAQAPGGEEVVSAPQVSRPGQLWYGNLWKRAGNNWNNRSLAQGIEGFYKSKGASDTMNLYKSVKYIPSSKISELQDDEGKSKKENKETVGRKSFKKVEE